ncbi:TerC family protein [Rhodoferax sp. U2-2l]|uniref:TerC family protein n=1 Tax=Rhodoferax sp. U2-2l TaxID=2884000 RepID=UPI001D0BDBCD|nr:TerC family protein [Rhodoferax sp. U2-2l]MCB8746381.1 TerC family protein [Rhodoferax sp. U2-2l]
MPELTSSLFWIAVLQIIIIDIMLGGDNAVVIALACRKLPPEQRKKGIFWGVVGAIGLRVVMIFFALKLLAVPYLKIVGGLLLFWIGIKLMLPDHDDGHGNIDGGTTLMAAIKTIVVADAVMSLDNVIAVAGASHGSMVLVTFGILVSIPIVVWGSKLVLTLMDRFPVVITLGAALLGWIAGGMLLSDRATPEVLSKGIPYAHYLFAAAGAVLVVVVGKWLGSRRAPRASVELAAPNSTKTTEGDLP